MSRNPFSFKIDYAAALREDEAEIEIYKDEGLSARLGALWASMPKDPTWDPTWQPSSGSDVLRGLGQTDVETVEKFIGLLPDVSRSVMLAVILWDALDNEVVKDEIDTYVRGELKKGGVKLHEIRQEIRKTEELLTVVKILSDEQRREILKKAKASRARHLRNKAKFGGS